MILFNFIGGFGALLLFLGIYHYVKRKRLEKKTGLRSLPGFPILGTVLQRNQYMSSPTKLANAHKRFGSSFIEWMFTLPFIICSDPEDVAAIFKPRQQPKPDKGMYEVLKSFAGYTSIFADSDLQRWGKRRKIVSHAFSLTAIRDMMSHATPMCTNLIAMLDEYAERKQAFDVDYLLQCFAFDLIARLGFNANTNATMNGERDVLFHSFQSALDEMFRSLSNPLLVHLKRATTKVTGFQWSLDRKITKMRNLVKEFLRKSLEQRQQEGTTKTSKHPTVFDLLLEQLSASDSIDETALLDDAITFLFAGHDTTAHSLAFALWQLCEHPEVLRKAREEVDSVLGDKAFPEPCDLSQLTYVEAVFKESLRLYGAVSIVGREFAEDLPLSGGGCIPGGEVVSGDICTNSIRSAASYSLLGQAVVSIVGVHRSEKVYKHADQFIPERWVEDDFDEVAKRPWRKSPVAFIPFAGGARDCVGKTLAYAEAKTVLALLLKNYSLELARSVEYNIGILLQPVDGVWLKVSRRK